MVGIRFVYRTFLELNLQSHLLALILALNHEILKLDLLVLELFSIVENVSLGSCLVLLLMSAH